jgi:antitoxin component of MazEF toxin-antitoxin module
MIKQLTRHGNSWALVIDKPILELLKIDPELPVEISTDGRAMIVTPVSTNPRSDKVRAARKKVNARYSKVFKKLAQ